MSLIVEDGTIVAGAESYISVADADTYHTNRANAAWTGATGVKEAALRRATDYMLQMYRGGWKGYRVSAAQALDWPRSFVYLEAFIHGAVNDSYPYLVSNTIVPDEVKYACAELAMRSLAGDLAADLDRQAQSEQIGPIRIDYDRASPYTKSYRAVDAMLAPYITSSPQNTGLVRA